GILLRLGDAVAQDIAWVVDPHTTLMIWRTICIIGRYCYLVFTEIFSSLFLPVIPQALHNSFKTL
ncbi:hypothetical protein ACJX0J_017247, partial [Zea mays]